jgi:hypothetical protein
MGSVKDFKVIREATLNNLGQGKFVFSDRCLVFDWREMPDHIKTKDAALFLLPSCDDTTNYNLSVNIRNVGSTTLKVRSK